MQAASLACLKISRKTSRLGEGVALKLEQYSGQGKPQMPCREGEFSPKGNIILSAAMEVRRSFP